jgi:two-component system alkaline phosphatase synthesis response regulator PhoP
MDVMMPEMDGMEACENIENQVNNVLITFLTAKSEDYSQVAGFDVQMIILQTYKTKITRK